MTVDSMACFQATISGSIAEVKGSRMMYLIFDFLLIESLSDESLRFCLEKGMSEEMMS